MPTLLESKGNASSSIQYYDRIIGSPWMTAELKDRAVTTKDDMMKYLDSDYVYQEILNEANQLKAWDIAIEAIVNHPKDDRIEAYIIEKADAFLEDAIASP
ncbi:MAG: hypothetical protein U5K84_06435 [Alkalibacterium sp.]|nr:hypothetical protein [Alkalibacterium sp.]